MPRLVPQMTECDECQAEIHRSRYQAKDGRRLCRPCRDTVRRQVKVCPICSTEFTASTEPDQVFCARACYMESRRVHTDRNAARRAVYAKRLALIKAAGGLTAAGMVSLLALWKAQGRRCTYCGGPCQSVDHVVPLIRGGTNYEGNLTPACSSCNHRKGTLLVAEWRYRLRCTSKVAICATG